ncbi:BatA domain-containing protein [Spirosoma arcticum]
MTFIEPFLLWGTLAVAIPIVIHFWHQKRGKPLPWAATQWLTERNQQQSRGLRLDNVLLLLLRCLLLILLAALLAQPVLKGLAKTETIQKIHLVQPSPVVTDNFRFELDEARNKGEEIILADRSINPLNLQAAINGLPAETTELHLYIINNQSLADVPAITVPTQFHLHTVVDSTQKPRRYMTLSNNKRLYIDRSGKLTSTATPDPTGQFQGAPVHSGPIRVLLEYQSAAERQTVRAALNALTDVYALALSIDEKKVPDVVYDWVLMNSSRLVSEPARTPKTFYTISGSSRTPTTDNVVFMAETLTPQTSELVAGGRLPEWLGEQLIQHYGLLVNQTPLSQQALTALFVPTTARPATQQASVQNALTLLFIGLLLLERWLSLAKNA